MNLSHCLFSSAICLHMFCFMILLLYTVHYLKLSQSLYFIHHFLDSFLYVHVCLVMGSPALDTTLQINLISQSRGNHVPQPAGNTACKGFKEEFSSFTAKLIFTQPALVSRVIHLLEKKDLVVTC